MRWLVDGNNVMGARPDGWWRDRAGAGARLAERIAAWARERPSDEVTVVFDGRERPLAGVDGIAVEFAGPGPDAADDRIARRTAFDDDPATICVVTSDAALARRVREDGASVLGAGAFRSRLDAAPGSAERLDVSDLFADVADPQARAARLQLLTELHDDGVPFEALREAVADGRLALLPVERLLSSDERYTRAEVAERSGLEPEQVDALRQALGLPRADPDARRFGEKDVVAARQLAGLLALGVPFDSVIELQRVVGTAFARYAEALRREIGDALIQPGDSEYVVAQRYATVARGFLPLAGASLVRGLELHLREGIRNDVLTAEQIAEGHLSGGEVLAVAFADLVGFTALGEASGGEHLGSVATRLAALTAEAIDPGVRLVKTIGDAVMLVAHDPVLLLASVQRLLDAAEREPELPRLRAGIALGEAVNRFGDWYGAPVNLASRITGRARPGSLLVTAAVRDAAREAGLPYKWRRAGSHRLKGLSRPVPLYRARHRPPADDPDPSPDESGL